MCRRVEQKFFLVPFNNQSENQQIHQKKRLAKGASESFRLVARFRMALSLPSRYVEAYFDEQSRNMKDMDRSDRDAAIQSTDAALPDHGDSWLRGGSSSASVSTCKVEPSDCDGDSAGSGQPGAGKRRKVTTADEAPSLAGKMKKELFSLQQNVTNATTKLSEAARVLEIA